MDLSIIIVNWNSAEFLRKCLQSVYVGTKSAEFEVIVVDNASFDHASRMLAAEFPTVKYVQSDTNLGFSRANNLGASAARGRNFLFLNPDTEVLCDAVDRMSSFLDLTPDAGIVGCRLLNSDLSVQMSCVQKFPTILNQVLDAEFLRGIFPRLELWGMKAIFRGNHGPSSVEVISGACLMIKAAVFRSIGQFTPNYFMYAEDADLCYKSWQSGFRNYYIGDVSVVHHGSGSSDAKPQNHFATVMMRQSLLEYMRIRRGRLYAVVYQCSIVMIASLRLFLLAVALPFSRNSAKRDLLRRTSTKWFKVLRWALGLETWAKQAA